jgi:hypothetical protein
MAGKRRSGLANDRRAYRCTTRCPPTYTVTYHGNGSTSGAAPKDRSSPYKVGLLVRVLGNVGIPIAFPPLAKTQHAFVEWNTKADGTGVSYSQDDTFTINEDTRLYAQWIRTYTVTYDNNYSTSGSAPIDELSPYVAGSTVTVLGNSGSLENTGFAFVNWNTERNGDGVSYSEDDTFTINEDTPLFAKWTLSNMPLPPTALSSVGGERAAYILFTQSGTVTNYEYSTDDGETFVAFDPPQIYSPVNINTLSSNVLTRLTNGTPYIVRLKAVNSGVSSDTSVSVTVVPGTTELLADNRIIYLDANNPTSYSGSGTAWTNLDPNMVLSATLNGSPTFNSTNAGNKYFEFNPGAATGQFALINQNIAINPVVNQPFTIQMWVRINNVGSQGGTLVSKMFDVSQDYDGYNLQYTSDTKLQLHLNGAGVDDNNRFSQTNVLSNGWALYTANIKFGNQSVGGSNKVFVNGREVLTFINFESNIFTPTQNLTFPAGYGPEGECDIGQFYYYNTELTTTQIIQNFDATKPRYNV